MARWTNWRMIADRTTWYPDTLDWDGPACYELSIAGSRGGNRHIVYVGETSNERKRIIAYASHGSHLSEIVHTHLSDGWHLHYRACAASSKREAVRLQDDLLSRWDYDWNLKLNVWGK
jgi:hypothetical protein